MAAISDLTTEYFEKLATLYPIGQVKGFEHIEGGSQNTSYLLETNIAKYIVTVIEEKTLSSVSVLIQLYEYLVDKGFPTLKIIRSNNGDAFYDYKGKPVVVKEYFDGTIVEDPSPQLLKKIGKVAATLNQLPVLDSIQRTLPYGLEHFHQASTWKIDHPFISWLQSKEILLRRDLQTNLPTGLIHGDIYSDNIIRDNDKFIALIDFEEASCTPFVFELGVMAVGICNENTILNLQKFQHIVSGYNSIRGLSKAEKLSIQLYCVYAATAVAFWRFRQFNIIYTNSDKSMRYKEMMLLADTILAIDPTEFYNSLFH